MSSSQATAWGDALDALEHDLAQFEAVLDDPNRPPARPTFEAPADLGPIPAEHAARAIRLAAAFDAAVERAEAEAARVRAELQRVSAQGRAAAARPARSRVDFQG
jgi:hypothetical protein